MKKHKMWGFAILIVLLGIAGIFSLIQQDTNTESELVLSEGTKKLLKEGVKQTVIKPPSPSETEESRETYDNNLHTETQTEQLTGQVLIDKVYPLIDIETLDWENLTSHQLLTLLNRKELWGKLTQEIRDTIVKEFYKRSLGTLPPPQGYYYRCNSDGSTVLDENGMPKLFKDGEPVFMVKKTIGYHPTREQHERYKQLSRKYSEATWRKDSAEQNRLSAAMEKLRAEAQGEIPFITASTQHTGDINQTEWNHKLKQRKREDYRKMDIEYILDY